MAKTMNRIQEYYILCKANLKLFEEEGNQRECEYLAAKGIKNADGTTPERIYCIDDDAIFEVINAEYQSPLYERIEEARNKLRQAEENLIEYGISIAPAGIREALRNGVHSYTIRQKLIDLVCRLDVSTVK